MDDNVNEFLDAYLDDEEAMWNKARGVTGWSYRSLPYMTRSQFNELVDLVGGKTN